MLASLFVTVIGAKITSNESDQGLMINSDRRPRTKVEQQFLHQFNQLGKPFKVFTTCFQESLSCYLGDLIFLIKIAFESQGAIYWSAV